MDEVRRFSSRIMTTGSGGPPPHIWKAQPSPDMCARNSRGSEMERYNTFTPTPRTPDASTTHECQFSACESRPVPLSHFRVMPRQIGARSKQRGTLDAPKLAANGRECITLTRSRASGRCTPSCAICGSLTTFSSISRLLGVEWLACERCETDHD
jgi:hypothetical protein